LIAGIDGKSLEPDTQYLVYVLAHTVHGRSLPSTIEEFYTRSGQDELGVCSNGAMPLFHPNGHRVIKSDLFYKQYSIPFSFIAE
jgi:hypothetical protein